MKRLGVILALGLTLLIVIVIGAFSFLPMRGQLATPTPLPESVGLPILSETTDLEHALAERESVYLGQLAVLNTTLGDRKHTYDQQIETLTLQLSESQAVLAQLSAQETELQIQLDELQSIRAERRAVYDDQLAQASQQYQQQLAQLQSQLATAQARLEEARAQLGR